MKLIDKVRRSELVTNVAVLASGTALAQAISVLASPVLTRLYSPESFGVFATFIALVSTIVPAATGKYEVALMLPPSDRAARELFSVAFWFCLVLCLSLFAISSLAYGGNFNLSSFDDLGLWLLVAPVGLFLSGINNLSGYVANRRSLYRPIATSMILQSCVAVSVNIALGVAGASHEGLIIGNLCGLTAALIYLTVSQAEFLNRVSLMWSLRKSALARRYRSFPIYNASTGVLNGFTTNLPIFMIMAFFDPAIAGYYALVVRVLAAPLSFISSAVSRVNLKKVVDLANSGSDIVGYIYKAAGILLVIAMPPALLFIVWGPPLFSLVFGDEWLYAGRLSQIMALALVARFVSSTLSTTLGATNNNKYGALWKTVAFASTAIVLYAAAQTQSVDVFILAMVINEVVIYSLYFYLILLAARNPKNRSVTQSSRRSSPA